MVAAEDASPQHAAVFPVQPDGDETARYTVRDRAGERAIDGDFRGLGLSAPVDQSDDCQLERVRRDVVAGELDHRFAYEAVPGAEVTVTANGRSSTAVADADGIAVVDVHLVRGGDDLSAQQTLHSTSSDVDVAHYLFD